MAYKPPPAADGSARPATQPQRKMPRRNGSVLTRKTALVVAEVVPCVRLSAMMEAAILSKGGPIAPCSERGILCFLLSIVHSFLHDSRPNGKLTW